MISVACLGAGYFSQFHIAGWRAIEGVEILGVADTDLARAGATGFPVFDGLATMLAATSPDILDIILPPPAQAQAIREGLDHGVRAIICQKPFCTSLSEAEEMAHLAQAHGIPLIIHENFRFQPWYRAIAEHLAAGTIGTPLQACFRLRPGDGQGPDAYLDRQPYFQTMQRFLVHETLVHWIDTFRFLFGPIRAVYGDLRRINPAIKGEDAGTILLHHDDGMRSTIDGNRHLDHGAENTRCTMGEALIEGTKGTMELLGDGSLWHRPFGTQSRSCILTADTSGTFGGNCATHLQAHVVAGLETGQFENRAEDYLDVLRVEAAVYESAEAGSRISI